MLATSAVHFSEHPLLMDMRPCWDGTHASLWNDLHNEWAVVEPASTVMDMQHQADMAYWKQQMGAFESWFPHEEHGASWNHDMAMGLDEGMSTCVPALPEFILCQEFPLAPQDPASSLPRSAGKERSRTDARSVAADLACMMSPMRLPVGPAPVSPLLEPLPAAMSMSGAALETMELPPGLLPPPGITLARAASLSERAPRLAEPAQQANHHARPSAAAAAAVGRAGVETPPQEEAMAVGTTTVAALCAATAINMANHAAEEVAPGIAAAINNANHAAEEVAPGICIAATEVEGRACKMVSWSIEDLRSKLRDSMGRPLVSPPFSVSGLCNLRFIVFPDARDLVRNARSRERKGVYANMIKKGPLYGSLKLKADCLEVAASLSFYLTVGSVRRGPFTYDFSESAIHGCDDFDVDWLQQIEAGTGNLCVSAEIVDFTARAQ